MITFLMLIAWVFLAIYCPKIFYGYSWNQLEILMNDSELQTASELLNKLGITEETENITQKASKQFYTCIAIVIGSLILVFIIRKLLKSFDQYLDRKNRVANAEAKQKINNANATVFIPTRTPEENIDIINHYTYDCFQLTFTGITKKEDGFFANIKLSTDKKITFKSTDFSVMVNGTPVTAHSFLINENDNLNVKTTYSTKKSTLQLIFLNPEETVDKPFKIFYKGKLLNIGDDISFEF